MDSGTLSSAIVTYVWGLDRRPWPSRDRAAIAATYGPDAADVQDAIDAVFAVVDDPPPVAPTDWDHEDLLTATRRIERILRAAYPELTDEAVRAVGGQFSYTWR